MQPRAIKLDLQPQLSPEINSNQPPNPTQLPSKGASDQQKQQQQQQQ